MTRRALVLLILFVIAAAIAVQSGRRLFFNMAYLLGATLLFSFAWAWLNLRWVGMSRLTQALRAQVGKPVEERFVVHNRSWLPKLWLEVRDESELPGHAVSRVVHGLAPRHGRSWNVKTNARYRGRYRLGPMFLVSGDPFGLFQFRLDLPQTSAITVFPATYDLPGFAPPVGRLLGGESRRRRAPNVTPNFAGVRDYVPGDSLNRIHWPSSARTGRLIVKEFEEDPTSDLWIVLDMFDGTRVAAPEQAAPAIASLPWLAEKLPEILPVTTEYAVTAAASLFKHFLEQNRAVGMIAHAAQREVMQPDRGLRPLTRALDHLAVLQAEGRRTVAEVLALEGKYFTRGTTVVVVTSSTNPAWVDVLSELKRRGIRPIAVLVDPTSFRASASSQEAVRAALAIRSVPTYVIRKDDAIPAALSKPA